MRGLDGPLESRCGTCQRIRGVPSPACVLEACQGWKGSVPEFECVPNRALTAFVDMRTLAEIEQAISRLPSEQWVEIRRWMDAHAPNQAQDADMARFDAWLSASTGIAKGKLTTDERMSETRGEA